MIADEETALSQLYAEFSDEDKKLAEGGLADYAALFEVEEREDGQFSQMQCSKERESAMESRVRESQRWMAKARSSLTATEKSLKEENQCWKNLKRAEQCSSSLKIMQHDEKRNWRAAN
jgi:hypothetical protein